MNKNPCCPALTAMLTLALATAARAQPVNDLCANAIPITNGSVTSFDMTTATRDGLMSCANFAVARDVWYTYTASEAEHVLLNLCGSGTGTKGLGVFTGCNGEQLACNRTGGCGTGQPQLTFDTPGPGTYLICVTILTATGNQFGILTLNATPLTGVPTKDLCGEAFPIGGDVTVPFNTAALTTDRVASCGGANDGWFVWQPARSGVGKVSTCELTTGDSVLSAYSGCGGGELSCSDDFCSTASQISFPVTFGVPVWVRIASRTGDPIVGQVDFSAVSPPQNDLCENAQVLPGPGSYVFSNRYATNQSPSAPCNIGGRADACDVFFRYTPNTSGFFTVDCIQVVQNTPFDATLEILDGCGGSILACSDDYTYDPGSYGGLTCPTYLTAGSQYIIRVASTGATINGGTGMLRLSSVSGPPQYTSPNSARLEPAICGTLPGDDVNSGCNPNISPENYRFTPVNVCDTYIGRAPMLIPSPTNDPIDGSYDADYYTFTLAAPDVITITGQAQFKGNLLVSDLCNAPSPQHVYGSQWWSNSCGAGEFSVSAAFPAGTFLFRIQNTHDTAVTCGVNDEYWFHISGTGPCPDLCLADIGKQGGVAGADHLLDNNDFVIFIDYFFNANPAADFGVQGGVPGHDGLFDNNDFIVFIDAFFDGCP